MAYGDNLTGDKPKDQLITVTALVAPAVLASRLTDATDVINQTHLSGKEMGAMVLSITAGTADKPTAFALMAATGSGPDAAWVPVNTAAAG